MALPTTGLQLHLDASVNTNLWKFYQASTPYHNTHPAHGENVETWDDADGKALTGIAGISSAPQWVQTTPLMPLPNLDFNGTTSQFPVFDTPGTAAKPISAVISATAFVVVAAIRIEGATGNFANPYENDGVIADGGISGGYWGIHVRNNAGAYTLQFYNYTSAANTISISVALNTNYVIVYWHTASSIFAEVYTTAGLVGSGNTASGTTSNVTIPLTIGSGIGAGGAGAYFNGKIGELAIYNAYNATDKTNAVDYFKTRWAPSAGPAPPTLTAFSPNSAYANATVPVKLIGVAFGGTGLDGAGGAFSTVSGFTFSNMVIAGGGAAGTLDIQIAAGQAVGSYNFTYTTTGGSSSGTSGVQPFTISSPAGGTSGDTGGNVRFNAGFN